MDGVDMTEYRLKLRGLRAILKQEMAKRIEDEKR